MLAHLVESTEVLDSLERGLTVLDIVLLLLCNPVSLTAHRSVTLKFTAYPQLS